MTDKEYLFKELKDLISVCEVLKYSFEKTKPLLKKEDYSPDEQMTLNHLLADLLE